MSTIPSPPLNYLPYPIRENGHFGIAYDAARDFEVYLARTSQAVFNILALLDPGKLERRFPARAILANAHLRALRESADSTFRRIYRDLPCFATKGQPLFTIGDAALYLPPNALHDILLKSEAVQEAPFLGSEQVRSLAASFSTFEAAERAASVCTRLPNG